jgi:hypothetical protein
MVSNGQNFCVDRGSPSEIPLKRRKQRKNDRERVPDNLPESSRKLN